MSRTNQTNRQRIARSARSWSSVAPGVALATLAGVWRSGTGPSGAVFVAVVLVAAIFSAVAHAEAIARRVGEPYGTLTLAVAVTVVEVALIVVLLAEGGAAASTLARDTVFAAVMIAVNGVIGGAFLVNARRTHLVRFSEQGANALLATLVTLASLSLVLPAFADPDGGRDGVRLAFSGLAAAGVYGVFIYVQSVRHRWMFLAPEALADEADDEVAHVVPHAPESRLDHLGLRLTLLTASLVAVVGLAKTLSPHIEQAVVAVGAPRSFVGVIIALLVLLPEAVAALRAAARDEMQTSINLALGSSLASIGLTIPAVAVASIWVDTPVSFGVGGAEIVLLTTTAIVATLSFGSGKATVLQAVQHLTLFAAFLFLAAVA